MNRPERHLALCAASGLAALALACSTVRVSTDYDPSADFSRYRTFAFVPIKGVDEIAAGRIETAISKALEAHGLQPATGGADLRVRVHGRMSREKVITTVGGGWWHGWGGGMRTSTVQNVPVGTLIVGLVDTRDDKLVWRGTATDTITSTTGQGKQDELDGAMAKVFASYPPKPGQ